VTRIAIPKNEAGQAAFWTKKGLGQHLLRDPTVAVDTLTALNPGKDGILEIGPGLGALTESLLKAGGPVLAVEVDPKACQVLKQKFPSLHIVQADVLEADLEALSKDAFQGGPFHIAANLPYYITTPILARILESGLGFGRMAVLCQWEVGRRLAAGPGGKDYSALSVMAQFRCKVSCLRKVLPGAFTPVPKVDSALVLFERLANPAVQVKDQALFFRVVRGAFGKRRKMLRNSLEMAEGLGIGRERLDEGFRRSGIDPSRRPETLKLEEFAALANGLTGE
jgi:16S rRNA (adenine1518-N6/adenine1519-N6)-dimethyltransferase